MHLLKPFALIFLLLSSGCGNLTHADLKRVGSATIKFAGILKICHIELFSTESYQWSKDDWEKPITLRILYHRKIPAERLIQTANDALTEEFDTLVNQRFAKEKQRLHDVYQDVQEGDVYQLNYVPDKGLTLYRNDTEVFSAEQNQGSFARYYMHIWLGNNRLAASIERQLTQQV